MAKKPLDLQKLIREATKKAMHEEIKPIVKNVYKKHAEKLQALKPTDEAIKREKGQNATPEQRTASQQRLQDAAFQIADAMAADTRIQGDGEFLPMDLAAEGAFSVYNNTFPHGPLWSSLNSSEKLVFTEWIVDGKVMIHPALTLYRGRTIGERYEQGTSNPIKWTERNRKSEYNVYNQSWNIYKIYYRFKKKPFVNEAMEDLENNYMKIFERKIAERIIDEYEKLK